MEVDVGRGEALGFGFGMSSLFVGGSRSGGLVR